ncbi:MATE family efflux transporter, partial [Halorubrum sp. E3]
MSDEPSEDPSESPSEFGGVDSSPDDGAGDDGGPNHETNSSDAVSASSEAADGGDGDGGSGGDGDGGPDDGDSAPGDSPDERVSEESITEGSLIRPLFHLAWPIVVIQLLQVMYNVVDTLYLGRLSAEAVGAISLAFPLIFLLIAVAGGFTTAGAILVAQYTGADGNRSAGLVAGQTIFTVSVLSVLIGIAGYFYTRPALEILPSDADTAATVIPLAADYMEVIFAGIP